MVGMTDGRPNLTEGPVPRLLIGMSVPMVLGIAAILFFNIVDTFYVGQLGARELAVAKGGAA